MSDPSPDISHTSAMLRYESQKKSPGLAAVINFFFPGLGEAYAGQPIGGVFAFVLILILGFFTLGIVYALAAFIGIFTGISSAQRFNAKLAKEITEPERPRRPIKPLETSPPRVPDPVENLPPDYRSPRDIIGGMFESSVWLN